LTFKRIGISIGDPAGIGPELALRVAARVDEFPDVSIAIIGDGNLLAQVSQAVGLPLPSVITQEAWSPVAAENLAAENLAAENLAATLPRALIVSVGDLASGAVRPGHWTDETGLASYQWVRFAVDSTLSKRLDAVVTGPIQKEAWYAAGIRFPGHTELLAEMTKSDRVRMMLTSDEISCVLATVHIPLAEVASRLTEADVFESIQLAAMALEKKCRRRHDAAPRITVCGLNPHAGEHGIMSHHEEEQIIAPAIQRAQTLGMNVVGPLSPDTAFVPARRRITDVYVCMYHDQGLIPLKALAFDDAVNVTLGLPIVRTSVDHGTAMDIAWQGIATESSLMAAVRMASELIG